MFNLNKSNYSYVSIIKDSNETYNDFKEWLNENIQKDYKYITEKGLVYLYTTYKYLEEKLKGETSSEIKFKLKCLNKESFNRFNIYLENRKEEHLFINNRESKDYAKYTDLASWYSSTNDRLDKVVFNLFRKQIDERISNKSKRLIKSNYKKEEYIYIKEKKE